MQSNSYTMSTSTFNIVVCASCQGRNLQALFEAQSKYGYTITHVIVNRECGAIDVAAAYGIKAKLIPSKNNPSYAADMLRAIPSDTNLIVLSGYLAIVPEEVCNAFPRKIINLHPSLLPKYGGKGMYGDRVQEAVMAAREEYGGCTVHYVTPALDSGDIILQRRVKIDYRWTPEQLGARIFIEEKVILAEAIGKIIKEHS